MGVCVSNGVASGPVEHKRVSGNDVRLVLDRYHMQLGYSGVLGHGTYSICRQGTDTRSSGSTVAIKVYKRRQEDEEVQLLKFRRQVQVLQLLLQPLVPPAGAGGDRLWHKCLDSADPKELFLELLDYSKQPADGLPAADPRDGVMYLVTEMAQGSLKDLITLRKKEYQKFSKEACQNMVRSILVVMAGLHAKGLVHLDFKPENMMVFNGLLKLIDVDGCVQQGSSISISDSSISFSPCYSSPEWAAFLLDERQSAISAAPALDVWSIGMTVGELVLLDPVLRSKYDSFVGRGRKSSQRGSFLFMEWLSEVKEAPIPVSGFTQYDPNLADLLARWLLHPDPALRRTCAESLSHPYLCDDEDGSARQPLRRCTSRHPSLISKARGGELPEDLRDSALHKAALFKLKPGGRPDLADSWVQCDIWLTAKGSLSCWDSRENQGLVLVDAKHLCGAELRAVDGLAKPFAFEVKATPADCEEIVAMLAAPSAVDRSSWLGLLKQAGEAEMLETLKLGPKTAADKDKFLTVVLNGTEAVGKGDEFESAFAGKLMQLKDAGDLTKSSDWLEQNFAFAKGGCLMYWSEREGRQQVCYTSREITFSTVTVFEDVDGAAVPFGFSITLAASDEAAFKISSFAAGSKEQRSCWLQQFAAHGALVSTDVRDRAQSDG